MAALFSVEMSYLGKFYSIETDEENSFPDVKSKLFILDGLDHRIRPSKVKSEYDLYDDDDGVKIN